MREMPGPVRVAGGWAGDVLVSGARGAVWCAIVAAGCPLTEPGFNLEVQSVA